MDLLPLVMAVGVGLCVLLPLSVVLEELLELMKIIGADVVLALEGLIGPEHTVLILPFRLGPPAAGGLLLLFAVVGGPLCAQHCLLDHDFICPA